MQEIPLVDLGNAPEIYCDGLGRVEHKGAVVRFSPFVIQIGPDGIARERSVNVRIIMPTEAVGPAVELTLMQVGSGLLMPVTRFIAGRLLH